MGGTEKKGCSLPQARMKMVWENEKISSCLSEITNLTILKENVAAEQTTLDFLLMT